MMDDTLKALSDPTRQEILKALRKGDMSAGDISSRFDMTAPTISHHLNVLKDAKLVEAVRDGRHIIYSLNSTVFQDLVNELMEFMDKGKRK